MFLALFLALFIRFEAIRAGIIRNETNPGALENSGIRDEKGFSETKILQFDPRRRHHVKILSTKVGRNFALYFPSETPLNKPLKCIDNFLCFASDAYCLKNVAVLAGSHGLPELISIAVTVALHLWKKQMLLSVAGGTACYMLLVQLVF